MVGLLRIPALLVPVATKPGGREGPVPDGLVPAALSLLPDGSVGSVGPSAERLRPLLPVLGHYARTLRVPILLDRPPRYVVRPRGGDRLAIHCLAVPTTALVLGLWPRIPLVRRPFLFGHPLGDGGQLGFSAGRQLGRGRILDDPEGVPAVEVVGTHVYLLFDPSEQEAELAGLLLRRALDLVLPAAARIRSLSPVDGATLEATLARLRAETADLEAAHRAAHRRATRTAFVEECRTRLREEGDFLAREAAFIEDTLQEYSRRITGDTRRLRALEALGEDRAERASDSPSEGAELERLRHLPGVEGVESADGHVRFRTTMLTAGYGSRRFLLGRFLVDIAPDGGIAIRNLTTPVGEFDHPHVASARPSLGTAREGLAKLIGEGQLAAAGEVLLDFLQTVDPAEWRLPVTCWDEVPRGEWAWT